MYCVSITQVLASTGTAQEMASDNQVRNANLQALEKAARVA